jgi:hypothetical protein
MVGQTRNPETAPLLFCPPLHPDRLVLQDMDASRVETGGDQRWIVPDIVIAEHGVGSKRGLKTAHLAEAGDDGGAIAWATRGGGRMAADIIAK